MGNWSLYAFLAMAGLIAAYIFKPGPPLQQITAPDALAANELVYHQTALNYMVANPTFTGTVPEGSMVFPSWYMKAGPWVAVIGTAKVLATYGNGTMQVSANYLSEALQKLSGDGSYNGGDIGAGVTSSSGYIVPALDVPSVPTPAGIPTGVAVVFSQIQ